MNITKKEIDDYIVYIRDNGMGEYFVNFIESFAHSDCEIPISATVLKDGRSTFVWKVNGKKAKLGGDLIIKGFKPRGFIHVLARLFGFMRGERVFNNILELSDKTDAITAPMAYIVKSAISADMIISPYIEGENLADICLEKGFDENSESSKEMSKGFAEVLVKLHKANVFHGDLKWSNIIVGTDKSFRFVDLDSADSCRLFNKSAVMKDLVRFYRYGFEIDKLKFTEIFFEEYFRLLEESGVESFTTIDKIKDAVEALKPKKRQ